MKTKTKIIILIIIILPLCLIMLAKYGSYLWGIGSGYYTDYTEFGKLTIENEKYRIMTGPLFYKYNNRYITIKARPRYINDQSYRDIFGLDTEIVDYVYTIVDKSNDSCYYFVIKDKFKKTFDSLKLPKELMITEIPDSLLE